MENPKRRSGWPYILAAIALCLSVAIAATATDGHFNFAILGDRTGGAQPGVYEQVWDEAAAERPSFLITTGDSIEGMDDAAAKSQWQEVERIWKTGRFPLYLTPGNHDIWSEASEQLFQKYAGHPPRYSFDCAQAHFTILDNSRSDDLSAEDLDFLEKDLGTHATAPVKFIISHRPSWLMNVGFRNPDFPLHRLARRYGVQYVIAGHVHQMLHFELEGITYLSMPSSGGHLRLSGAYQDGWFFGHARVEVNRRDIGFQIEELKAPHGQGRITRAADWGMTGLLSK